MKRILFAQNLSELVLKCFLILTLVFASGSKITFAQSASEKAPQIGEVSPKSIGPRAVYGDIMKSNKSTSKSVNPATNSPYSPISSTDDQSQIPEVEMFVGESRVFPAPGVARIAVGNGALLTAAALDAKEVILFANAVGTSSLFVWNDNGNYQRVKVNIVPGDTGRISREIATFLNTIPNTKSSIIGDKIVVEGDSLTDLDILKIEALAKRYPQIVNFTNALGWEQMVMIDVKVVEFPINELREIGMKWGTQGGAAIGGIWRPSGRGDTTPYSVGVNGAPVTNSDGSSTGIPLPHGLRVLSALNLGLNAQINLLAQNGSAAILAEPQLSTRNGAKANFLAGGEYPYIISTINGPTVQFKPYGIKLDILPKVDKTGTIRAVIDTEVSSIDGAVTTAAGPGILTRKTNAEFNVKSGETIVLAGLIQRETNNSVDKVPGLGDLPIIGALFRSKRYQNKETELVIFVTPTIIDSASPGLVDRVNRTGERLEQIMGSKPYLSNPLQGNADMAKVLQTPPNPTPVANPLITTKPPVYATPQVFQLLPDSEKIKSLKTDLKTDEGSTLQVMFDGLVIREQASAKSKALFILGQGSVVRLGSAPEQMVGTTLWRNVILGEINGWVIAQWVSKSTQSPEYRAFNPSQLAKVDTKGEAMIPATGSKDVVTKTYKPKLYRVKLDQLALRLTPNVNSPLVQNLDVNTILTANTAPKGTWLQVETVESQPRRQGWVAMQWLMPVTE